LATDEARIISSRKGRQERKGFLKGMGKGFIFAHRMFLFFLAGISRNGPVLIGYEREKFVANAPAFLTGGLIFRSSGALF